MDMSHSVTKPELISNHYIIHILSDNLGTPSGFN